MVRVFVSHAHEDGEFAEWLCERIRSAQPVFRVPIFRPPYGSVPPGRAEREGRHPLGAFVQVEATYSLP
jgi:hypothetical protein